MAEIAISKFKAQCLALLEQVRRAQRPILVTRFGKPVAEVVPPPPSVREANWLGSMRGSMEIVGDIVSPVIEETDWEALHE